MKARNYTPKWLRQTQNNSWEPEIFISGIVLYGLIQTPELLEEFRYYFKREIYGFSTLIDSLIAILNTSIQWLIFGLMLHLFFRGIWIGLVGLSYVFPKGIKNDALNYKDKFAHRIDNIPHFTDQIIRLEKISSSIFSISYFIFMSIIGVYTFFAITIFIPVYLTLFLSGIEIGEINNDSIYNKIINSYTLIVFCLGLVYMFDFLTLGLLKKIKFLSKIYYPIYVYISAVTFSSLYRNVYYVLISNFKRWKVIAFIIVFIFVTLTLYNINVLNTNLSRTVSRLDLYGGARESTLSGSSYRNMKPDSKRQRVTIQNDIIKDDVLRVFVSQQVNHQDSIKTFCNYEELSTIENLDSVKLACLSAFYKVLVNDSLYNNPEWLFHYDPLTKHRGIISYIDISHLDKGLHRLNIELTRWPFKNYAIVPFYKE